METIVQLFVIVGSGIGATWAIRSKLSDIEVAIKQHVTEDKAEFHKLASRVIQLEERRKKAAKRS